MAYPETRFEGMKEAVQISSLDNLIDDHWQYIKGILEAHGEEDYLVEVIEYHYKTAFKHGYKHAKEEQTTETISVEELQRRTQYPMRETRFGLVPDYSENYRPPSANADEIVYATITT